MQRSAHDLSTFKKLSVILTFCVVVQLGVTFAFFIELDPFVTVVFLGPQSAGSIAALWYAHRPSDKKYSPHLFCSIGISNTNDGLALLVCTCCTYGTNLY